MMNEILLKDEDVELIIKSLLMKMNSIQFLKLDSTIDMKKSAHLDNELLACSELIKTLMKEKIK